MYPGCCRFLSNSPELPAVAHGSQTFPCHGSSEAFLRCERTASGCKVPGRQKSDFFSRPYLPLFFDRDSLFDSQTAEIIPRIPVRVNREGRKGRKGERGRKGLNMETRIVAQLVAQLNPTEGYSPRFV